MIRTFEDKNSFLCAAHPTVADLATAAKSALLRENSGAPRLWTCGGGLTAGFSTTTATIEMIQLLRIFSNWITKHTWMQKNRLYKNNHEKCLRRLLTNYDCIECDMANDAWKHWKEFYNMYVAWLPWDHSRRGLPVGVGPTIRSKRALHQLDNRCRSGLWTTMTTWLPKPFNDSQSRQAMTTW